MRALIMSAALVFAARSASAQDPLSAAKKAAQNAKAKADAHTEAMQRPEGTPAKTTAKAPVAAPQTKAAPPQTKAAAPQTKAGTTAKTAAKGAATKGAAADSAAPAADTAGPPPSILREVFDYAHDGRRDPFVSLLTTAELRPTISDLRLTSIIYDNSGRNSLATMRDLATNTRYTVKVGSTMGRMRVAAIRPLTVLLTIDEFGTTRQDSLILRDSTKVRRP
jgi:hypothetical protein